MINTSILNIAYFSMEIKWAYQVRRKMDEKQKKKYAKSGLFDIEKTISRKISLIKSLVTNTNLEMREINKILEEKQQEVDHCIKTGKALIFEEIYRLYRIIAYFESTLIQIVAVIDQLMTYISKYFSQILTIKKGQSDVLKMLNQDGIDTKWRKELYFIRRIVTHSYTGWTSFEKVNSHFQLKIDFPKSIRRMKDYKEYPYDSLGTDKINEIFRNFQTFYRDVTEWFVNINSSNKSNLKNLLS